MLRRFYIRQAYRGILCSDDANEWIANRIRNAKPSAIGKIGTLETELLVFGEKARRQEGMSCRPSPPSELRKLAFVNVGIFPDTDEIIWKFLDELRVVLPEIDGLSIWGKLGEAKIINSFCTGVDILTVSGAFAPWEHANPWSSSLADKRVLVVHPFAQTINQQYKKRRERIWHNHPTVLPRFHLSTLQMPLSAGLVEPEELHWHERLTKMKDLMSGIDFDVALIGAGGMSLPLAVHAKKMGCIGIHMGGRTQILFGIKGKCFDGNSIIQRAYNESWVRPGSLETPENASAVEDGCYW